MKAGKPARRRAAARGRGEDEARCHVVTLRRVRRESTPASGESGVDWSHRWMVRGHWRRQWFPRRKCNAPMWIHPYVKGPDDKPFRTPKRTVHHVVR